jgi:hypothetical protein
VSALIIWEDEEKVAEQGQGRICSRLAEIDEFYKEVMR